jgi:hypothetical protein
MGQAQDAILDALAAEIAGRHEWDQRPELFTLYYGGGRCDLRPVPLPDWAWAGRPPVMVLASLADVGGACAGLLQQVASGAPGLHGAAFFTEIWMAEAAGTAEVEDLLARARAVGGRASKLADRVEARSIWAVDRAGTAFTAVQARGSDEVRRALVYPMAGRPAAGEVPAALDRLVTALLGVTMPDRTRA